MFQRFWKKIVSKAHQLSVVKNNSLNVMFVTVAVAVGVVRVVVALDVVAEVVEAVAVEVAVAKCDKREARLLSKLKVAY